VAVREGTGKTEAAKLRGVGIGPKQRPQENALLTPVKNGAIMGRCWSGPVIRQSPLVRTQ
jgi:hypothetical protein